MTQFDLDNILTKLSDGAAEMPVQEKEEGEGSSKKARRARKPKRTCTETAIDILSRRNLSEAMMVEKLTQKKFSEEDIAHTMARLLEMNYLNDEAYIKGRVEYRQNVSGWGWMRIVQELKQQGLSRELIEQASYSLEEAETTEEDRAFELLERWLARKVPDGVSEVFEERQKVKDKALRYLLGRGFNYEQSKGAWERCTSGD